MEESNSIELSKLAEQKGFKLEKAWNIGYSLERALLQEWLRNHPLKIHVEVVYTTNNIKGNQVHAYLWVVKYVMDFETKGTFSNKFLPTYEKALEEALLAALNFIP